MDGRTADNKSKYEFHKKVLVASSIFFLFIIVLLIVKSAFNVLLLILAGALIAVYFRGISFWLSEKTSISNGLSLMVVISGTLLFLVLVSWLLGAKIQSQMEQLTKQLPNSSQELKNKISKYEWGKQILTYTEGTQSKLSSGQNIFKTVRSFFRTTFGILGDVYIILFIGVFFTANPSLYKNSIISLVPLRNRKRADEVISKIGYTLRNWLVGKIFAMAVVAILTGIGLLILGVPMPLALALIAGLLNFIPNFGPILAMIPAVLVSLTKGTTTAFIVAGLFIAIQIVESNFITPMAQKKLIQIPPAYIIIGQVAMGILSGGLGIILATPIIAIVMVLVQSLYIEGTLENN